MFCFRCLLNFCNFVKNQNFLKEVPEFTVQLAKFFFLKSQLSIQLILFSIGQQSNWITMMLTFQVYHQ